MRISFQFILSVLALTLASVLLETYAAVPLDHKKASHKEDNEVSKQKVDYKPVNPSNVQRKTYNQTVLTSVPNCYNLENETAEGTAERYMCVAEDLIYNLRISDANVDPTWLYWNDLNPMKNERVHCHNIALLYEKKLQCYQFSLYLEVYKSAVESIVEMIELNELLDMPIDDIFYLIEDYTSLSTEGLREELIDIIFETILEYILDSSNSSYLGDSDETGSEEGGPASYYYYYYYEDEH